MRGIRIEDVLADFIQFEPYGGNSVAPAQKLFPREFPLAGEPRSSKSHWRGVAWL
jgi:hypothetical protein